MSDMPVQQLLHHTTMEESMGQTWLVFIPQLPSSPSSLRVLVWRRMRAAGAAALQQGVWVLPQTPEHEQFLRDVLLEAQQQGGSGILLVATPLDADQAVEVVERFRADRDQEYHEFGVRCRDFLAEIAKETTAHNFTFAALEENEHDLQKLHTWLGRSARATSSAPFRLPPLPKYWRRANMRCVALRRRSMPVKDCRRTRRTRAAHSASATATRPSGPLCRLSRVRDTRQGRH